VKYRIALWVWAAAALAQQAAFEVASIKPVKDPGGMQRMSTRADGIDFVNVTPKMCIQRAYGVRPFQVTGPEWIDTERYTIAAKAAGAVPEQTTRLMLQALLAERFRLALHHETKEVPVYALVVAKGGPKVKEATGEGETQIDGDGRETVFERVSMGQLAGVLGRSLGRQVSDETALKGLYSFRLAWANPRLQDADGADDAPSIFAALQERLGLKLDSRKAPVDLLVVDHIERPAGN
jgi:uncharacterized protein (TIGR03435 family)